MSIARAMMLHAAIHWPEIADSSLWPMAVQHATYLHNNMPNPTTGLSPNDLFTRMQFDANKFHDLHVWGCLVYVLDKKISDGNKLPRWMPHSHHGVYMGMSPLHSSSVPLVLNPSTGSITPQFHVVFDDWFGSVAVSPDDLPDFNSDEWTKMFGDSSFQFLPDDNNEPSPDTSDTDASRLFASHQQAMSDAVATTTPPTPLPTAPLPSSRLEGAASSVPRSPPTPVLWLPLVTPLLLLCSLIQSNLVTRGRIHLFHCPQSFPPIRRSLHPPHWPSLPPLFQLLHHLSLSAILPANVDQSNVL